METRQKDANLGEFLGNGNQLVGNFYDSMVPVLTRRFVFRNRLFFRLFPVGGKDPYGLFLHPILDGNLLCFISGIVLKLFCSVRQFPNM